MHRTQTVNQKLDGELILRESPVDPVVDLPVEEVVSMTWEEGGSSSNASVWKKLIQWVMFHLCIQDMTADGRF